MNDSLDRTFLGERRAHAPLPAGAHIAQVVEAVIPETHRNTAAGRGCMTRLVGLDLSGCYRRSAPELERLVAKRKYATRSGEST
jgi:hypothetical protein